MISRKLWIIIKITVIFGSFWSFGEGSEVDEEHMSVHVLASVPENVKMRKISLEYEFHASDEFQFIVQQEDSPFTNAAKDNKEETQENSPTYNNCRDVPTANGSGVYNISINGRYKQVYCEVNPDGNNYLVIQRRVDGSLDFYRNWTEYENGFGNLNHEFWIGNQAISQITLQTIYKLRIELVANDSTKAYAEYNTFSVRPAETKYQLFVSGYSGTAGDSLTHHNGAKFSTFDQDNDEYSLNCAVKFKGAWWYKSCHKSNLNGFYYGGHHDSSADGVNWEQFKGYHESMKRTTMKIY